MAKREGYPEVGEIWVYYAYGKESTERPFLILEDLEDGVEIEGQKRMWVKKPDSYCYRCLDLRYGEVRIVEFGLYLEQYRKVA
jgi:hypothetical protein